MIRRIVTPNGTDLHLSIPEDYIGKEIEVLLYTTDELKEQKLPLKDISALRGKLQLSADQYKDLQKYINDTRDEWNSNI